MNIYSIIIIALLCEAIWESSKMVWQEGKVSIDRVGAMVVCIFIALISGIDIFVVAGVPLSIPIVGIICTGLLISRGANFIHDLYKKIEDTTKGTDVNG